jgi:hypothetical protein
MATIVGTDETAKKRITHRECATVIEYTENEVQPLWRGKDYSGGSDGADGFPCPKCGKNVIVNRW